MKISTFRRNAALPLAGALVVPLVMGANAFAAPLTALKMAVTPANVSTGQTVTLENSLRAAQAVPAANVVLEFHRVMKNGRLNSFAVYSKTLADQKFAAGETKKFRENFVVPPALISGTYAATLKVTNADGSVSYLDAAQNGTPAKFTVQGRADVGYARGINIMDLGISSQALPGVYGRNYTKPSLESLQLLKGQGLGIVRIPFLWERIQPVLSGELDAAYLGYLLEVLRDSNTAGLKVIIDMHNYGRYTPTSTPDRTAYAFGDPRGASKADFADVWKRIASAIRADDKAYAALYAYDLMNEPYNLVAEPPTKYAKNAISSFQNGTDNWSAQWPTTTTVARVMRQNQPALEIKGNATAGSGQVFRVALPATARALTAAQGKNLRFSGFVPAATPGDIKARAWIMDGQSQPIGSEVVTLEKGESFSLDFAPPAEAWKNNRGVYLDFMMDNSDGFAPPVFYLDEVSQGDLSGGKAPQRVWEEYSQAAVSAIRALNDPMTIHVEGYDFSSAQNWPRNHPTAWIQDPLNKTVYHAHQYLDDNSSGAYKLSHDKELALARKQGYADVAARGIARFEKFNNWLAQNKVTGFIGETGWPNAQMVGAKDGAAWNADGEKLYDYLDTMNLGATLWATGSWLSATDNILNTYVLPRGNIKFQPLSQSEVIEKHPGHQQ